MLSSTSLRNKYYINQNVTNTPTGPKMRPGAELLYRYVTGINVSRDTTTSVWVASDSHVGETAVVWQSWLKRSSHFTSHTPAENDCI